jgi:exosortase D (VPLPA-CTERM-specific)
VVLYLDIIIRLVQDWLTDDNYSHGFLIVPLALFFIWKRRKELMATSRQPNNLGLVVVVGSLVVLSVGLLGSELFLTRISLVGALSGTVLFLYGWQWLRVLAFPLSFLLFMIPIPRIVFDQIVFPLQLLASQLAEIALSIMGVPVLREGNLIVLAHSTLEVAEACSGIRSLVSLLALTVAYGYLNDPRTSVRTVLAIATVPVAIIANGLRVAGTGLAVQYYGTSSEAFFDALSGWVLFIVALMLLFALHRLLVSLAPLKEWRGRGVLQGVMTKSRLDYLSLTRTIIITLMITGGAIYLAGFSRTERVPLRESLGRLSMQFDRWRGKPTVKLDDRIVAKLGVDEYVNRVYYNLDRRWIHLYVAYYQSQRQGSTIHSPKNCLPGAGWQPVESGRIVIPIEGREPLEVNRYIVQKGMEKHLVLYWYQSHGRVVASEYWAKFYLVIDAIRMNRTDGALVRVISPIRESQHKAEQQAIEFTKALFPLLNRHLPI